ncbi:ATP-grasp fold amidoligase family protein [Gracilibacillus sp. S3-1-1]|uniref:ATP-grasp fold amidoligase family protein n=1 Tax=Gracilibacillus pellucidus TaxID=3095368 RepID=A0ACC6M7X9_9BACI|nr:ATP-grasp fold amidoligase family protein [Gracilibacillus sp. S3-1-1]MDX8047095.1 ATP-grasp fold amidoligase family protein [Gracilibacillus sp. S3-1-1]
MIITHHKESNDREQINQLIEKEAELAYMKKKNKQLMKETKKLKDSKKYQLADKLPSSASSPDNQALLEQIEALQLELDIEKQKNSLKEHFSEALSAKELERNKIESIIKQGREFTEIDTLLDMLIAKKQQVNQDLNHSIRAVAHLYKNDPNRQIVAYFYQKILANLSLEETPEFMLRNIDDYPSAKVKSSFQASLVAQTKKWQRNKEMPEIVLDSKRRAYKFVDLLKIRRPWFDEQTYSIDNIPLKEQTVIKPVDGAGSRGVYLVMDREHIQDVRRKKIISGIDALRQQMKQDIESEWVESDHWSVEELISNEQGKPAKDVKFYSFYGKVALILEIERYPALTYCWWTRDGQRISTGRYENELFKGTGVLHEEIELAEKISQQIPAPFIRIDFLKTDKELVFGEFTPKPGNFDEFDAITDSWLGEYYTEAETRLFQDLLDKKSFSYYEEIVKFGQEEKN